MGPGPSANEFRCRPLRHQSAVALNEFAKSSLGHLWTFLTASHRAETPMLETEGCTSQQIRAHGGLLMFRSVCSLGLPLSLSPFCLNRTSARTHQRSVTWPFAVRGTVVGKPGSGCRACLELKHSRVAASDSFAKIWNFFATPKPSLCKVLLANRGTRLMMSDNKHPSKLGRW
jgi:hypothetical protein